MHERARRRWVATEAFSLEWGGVTVVTSTTGLTRKTIHFNIRELEAEVANPGLPLPLDRVRRAGAGRKPVTRKQTKLVAALDALVEPSTRGDPQSPLRWTCKSNRRLAEALQRQASQVSDRKVAALQTLANLVGLKLRVCLFPPGTSKWNKIEHRMFSHITQNWRGKPLVSHEVIVQLIAHTTTTAELKVRAALDRRHYPIGEKVSRTEFENIQLKRADFRGDGIYTIQPH